MGKKIIRCATIGMSLNIFCKDILSELKAQGYDVVAVSSPDSDLKELVEREGVRAIGVPMERRISPWKDLCSLLKMYRVFRQEKPDMVHSMTPKAGLVCMIAAWLARVPVRMHTFTGLVWPTSKGLQRQVLMLTDRITCACATHVIPEGQGVLNDLAAHITSKPLKVLGYGNVRGIDLQYWQVNSSDEGKRKKEKGEIKGSDALEHPFTFLFVGRIVGDKGINELVTAFERFLTQIQITNYKLPAPDGPKRVKLVLVGTYEEELDPIAPETRQMIDSMPEIEAVGAQYGDDLKAWYAAADCFVFPSYREGFPNTVIEAGAMELPSIVTDINGSREIVADYRLQITNDRLRICPNGVVIPSKDAEALRDAMVWMLEHPEERAQMGAMARKMVADRYEQGFVRQCLYDFYKEVLGESLRNT